MERRQYLQLVGVGGVGSIAGCGGGGGSRDSGESTDTQTATPEGTQLTDLVEYVSHDFVPPEVGGGFLLEVTVQNVSDRTLDIVYVDANLYEGDTRLGDASLSIGEFPSGVEQTEDMGFPDGTQYQDQITDYEIIISTRTEDLDEVSETYEFDEFEYP